jgi:hypothetical protein
VFFLLLGLSQNLKISNHQPFLSHKNSPPSQGGAGVVEKISFCKFSKAPLLCKEGLGWLKNKFL